VANFNEFLSIKIYSDSLINSASPTPKMKRQKKGQKRRYMKRTTGNLDHIPKQLGIATKHVSCHSFPPLEHPEQIAKTKRRNAELSKMQPIKMQICNCRKHAGYPIE